MRREFGKKRLETNDPMLKRWTSMFVESLGEAELSESTSDADIINTAFSTLLYFLTGEGNKVLKDQEWMNYLVNDINTAIQNGMFHPSFEDKQHIRKLQEIQMAEESDDDNEDSEEETED